MINHVLRLNGDWLADYLSDTPYIETAEPAICPESHSLTIIPVPGYWEDMGVLFETTGLHKKLKTNPLYTDQSYPQTGYCADLFLPNPVGCLVYRKSFALSEIPSKAELYIGGAQNTVSAWINGSYIGCHKGYSTPFSFPIPDDILALGENRVTLAVSNNRLQGYMGRPVSGLTSRAANECTGGIYGDVEIVSYPDGLQDLWVTVSADCQEFTVHTEGACQVKKCVAVWDAENCVGTWEIPAGSEAVTLSAEGFLTWSPDAPKLYQVTVTTDNQQLSCRFGVRRLTAEDTRLYLNGEPYYFRGICEHCYQYATVHPTRDKSYYIALVQKLKVLGFNAIRFHTWIPPYEYMEAADEVGILLEVETPNNTAADEWEEIIRFCRHHTAVNIYSTGNELQIDYDYEKHLSVCGDLVHSMTDSLFSPMSAMRGVEYMLTQADERVAEPFEYNPKRLAVLDGFSDLYNSYSLGLTSYDSSQGTQAVLDDRNRVYGKPLLSHEICIQGTYIDLSLEERYEDTRIGKTQFMSSVRTHLADKKLLHKADLYYKNSSKWQSLLRKQCFETVRRCHTFAGYDFLGDIDTHWHTFGYCVGMMNEFYELKPGETAENVLRYNSPSVLLADLPDVSFVSGQRAEIPIWVSYYDADAENAAVRVWLQAEGVTIAEKQVAVKNLKKGDLRELCRLDVTIPALEKAVCMQLCAELSGTASNCWELYGFPKTSDGGVDGDIIICDGCDIDTLEREMQAGKTVVIFGTEPFASVPTTFQLSIAGRTTGHLATVIAEHPLMDAFPHQGFCGKQFEKMLNGGSAVILDGAPDLHDPIVDIATTYKNAQREALLFAYRVEKGRLLCCGLHLSEDDPAAQWLKKSILSYVQSENFEPEAYLTAQQLRELCRQHTAVADGDTNRAVNRNDVTAQNAYKEDTEC